jgi:HSP20 family protein
MTCFPKSFRISNIYAARKLPGRVGIFPDRRKIASPPQTQTEVVRKGGAPSNRHWAGRDSGAGNPARPESESKTMTALTRWNPLKEVSEWNPFRELDEMHNRLSRFFGTTTPRRNDGRENITVAEWAPLVDITEDDKEYLIKAELPEVKKGDVKVRVEDGVLYISGERNFEKEEKGKRYHRIERAYGSFTRSFALPEDADPQQVNADFKDGVLSVHVAKDKNARPKSIEVKVA